LKDLLKSILKGTVQLPVKSSVMQYEQDALPMVNVYYSVRGAAAHI